MLRAVAAAVPSLRTMARIALELDGEDARVLRGALLAARATELAELHRRGFRHGYGKASDSAAESISAEVAHHRRRIELLDRLIEALPTVE